MSTTNRPVVVTGATGSVGGRVARRLAQAGVAQRLIVRDPGRAALPPGLDARTVGGYADRAGLLEALRGAGTLFLVPATEAPDRVEQHATVVDAAVAAGAQRIVYLSFVGAAPAATFTFARDHWATELHVRRSGLPFVFLRMNLFTDVLPSMVGADGTIAGPAGAGRLASVTRDDVAAAAAAVLAGAGHDGATYDLTGPEALTLTEAAAQMAVTAGRPVRYVDETDEEAYAARAPYGAPAWQVEGWVTTYHAIRDGSLAEVGPGVRDLTGREPQSLRAYLRRHPGCLDHVEDPPPAAAGVSDRRAAPEVQ